MLELRNKGRRTLVQSRARLEEAKAALVINAAIRSFLDWLHAQPWYGLSKEVINPVITGDVVASKARRAAAERVVGKCLSKWAHVRVANKGEQLLNRVRRKMAVFKIQKMLVTGRKKRPYQYRLMVTLAVERYFRVGLRRDCAASVLRVPWCVCCCFVALLV